MLIKKIAEMGEEPSGSFWIFISAIKPYRNLYFQVNIQLMSGD